MIPTRFCIVVGVAGDTIPGDDGLRSRADHYHAILQALESASKSRIRTPHGAKSKMELTPTTPG
jgi:hypothetical protein